MHFLSGSRRSERRAFPPLLRKDGAPTSQGVRAKGNSRFFDCARRDAPDFAQNDTLRGALLRGIKASAPSGSGGLEFEEDAGAFGFEVQGGGFAVVFAQDAGAHAEAEAGGFVAGGLGNEGIEGAGGHGKF